MGQISAAVLLKHFSRPLNLAYKEHYNFKLASRKNINIHNEFLQEPHYPDNPMARNLPPIKDIAYMFAGVSTGYRQGKLVNSELVGCQEIELENSCSIIHKPISFESLELFGGFEPLLVILTRVSKPILLGTSQHLKLFFEILFKLIMTGKPCLSSLYESKSMKALVGFLEPLAELMNEDIQSILGDILEEDLDSKLFKILLKYLFLNINFICRTPLSFQKFAAKTVTQIYLNSELKIHEQISLDWIIKYQTIYSILETTEEPKEPTPVTISGFRVSGGPTMEEDIIKDRTSNSQGTFNFIFGSLR